MTEPSDSTAHPEEGSIEDVIAERRRLLSLAYRMTGTIGDAEDVVQGIYARW